MNLRNLFERQTRGQVCPPACVPTRGAGLTRALDGLAPDVLEEVTTPVEAVWLPFGEGCLPLRLDLCTDFGPPDDDKLCNQDAVAFAPLETPFPGVVVALADGVSNSPYSEFGARLAVQTMIRHVPEALRRSSPANALSPPSWQRLFEEAADAVRRQMFVLWSWLHSDPGGFLPPRWRPDIFYRAVREQNVFHSTLIAAVILRESPDQFWGFFAHVGDGSLSFCRDPFGHPQVVDALVCDPQTALTSSLGPAVEHPCFPQCSFARLGAEFHLGLATDGVGRAFPMQELLLRFQQQQQANGRVNAAHAIIEQLKQECPDEVADNLSLAFLTCAGLQPASPSEKQP